LYRFVEVRGIALLLEYLKNTDGEVTERTGMIWRWQRMQCDGLAMQTYSLLKICYILSLLKTTAHANSKVVEEHGSVGMWCGIYLDCFAIQIDCLVKVCCRTSLLEDGLILVWRGAESECMDLYIWLKWTL
jgi:hypothetical protein